MYSEMYSGMYNGMYSGMQSGMDNECINGMQNVIWKVAQGKALFFPIFQRSYFSLVCLCAPIVQVTGFGLFVDLLGEIENPDGFIAEVVASLPK